MPSFIGDGYEEKAYLRAVPKLHDAVHFTFRPMLADERAEFVDRNERLTARERTRKAAEALEHHLLEWDIRGKDGKLLPILAATILRLHPNLFNRLLWVVSGTEAWDDDPERPEAHTIADLTADAGN